MQTTLEKPTTGIVEYDALAAAMADLEAKYRNARFEVETPAGDKAARAARLELVQHRTSLEKIRKQIKEPALERCKQIDAVAKTLSAKISALEIPIDEQIRAVEAAKEAERQAKAKAEQDRIAAHQRRLASLADPNFGSRSVAELGSLLAKYDQYAITEEWEEFQDQARVAKINGISRINRAIETTKEREAEVARFAAERAELDARRAEMIRQEQLENARIAEQRKAHQAQLDVMRAAEEAEQAKARAVFAEEQRIAREAREAEQAKLDAQRREIERQQAARQAEIDAEQAKARRVEAERQAAIEAEHAAELAKENAIRNAAPEMLVHLREIVAAHDRIAKVSDFAAWAEKYLPKVQAFLATLPN